MIKFTALLTMGMVAVSAIAIVTATVTAYADDQPDGSSRGNTLITGTLWAQAPIYFACNLTNVGHKSRTVSTRIINGSNGKELLAKTMKLAPRITMNTTLKGLPEPGGPIYCEFTVEGSRKDFRGVAKLWPGPTAPNSSDITAIAAE